MNYCEKNSKELQTANLLVQRNIPVTFVQSPTVEPEAGADTFSGKDKPNGEPTATSEDVKEHRGAKVSQPKKTPMAGKL